MQAGRQGKLQRKREGEEGGGGSRERKRREGTGIKVSGDSPGKGITEQDSRIVTPGGTKILSSQEAHRSRKRCY